MPVHTQHDLLLQFLAERYPRIVNVQRVAAQFDQWLVDKGFQETRSRVGRPRRYPLDKMAVGEIMVFTDCDRVSMAASICAYNKKHDPNKVFTTIQITKTDVILKREKDRELEKKP